MGGTKVPARKGEADVSSKVYSNGGGLNEPGDENGAVANLRPNGSMPPERIDTLRLLEDIEEYVATTPHFMGLYRFSEEEFFTLVNKLRASLPEDVRRAGRIAENSSKILTEAHSEAEQSLTYAKSEAQQTLAQAKTEAATMLEAARNEGARIVQEAHDEARRLTDTHEIARHASARAEEIERQANGAASEMIEGADEYTHESLTMLERSIKELLTVLDAKSSALLATVQKGRQQLERHAASADNRPNRAAAANESAADDAPAAPIRTAAASVAAVAAREPYIHNPATATTSPDRNGQQPARRG